jgi:hypothetical protein
LTLGGSLRALMIGQRQKALPQSGPVENISNIWIIIYLHISM